MTQTTFSPNGRKRAVLYARVSSDDSKKDGRNLQSQLEMCRTYSKDPKRDYNIVDELPEDDKGASGASFDLPQLGKILAMAERKEFDVLVVRELDRLSRNLAKQLIVEESLKRNGVTVEYVLADYADSPEGNLQKHIKATIAEYEREKIKERMVRGRRNVVKSGRIMLHGDRPPYGYQAVMEKRNGKDIATGLKIHESEARIIRLIFDWYTIGDESGARLSLHGIATKLSGMQVPTWSDIHGIVPKQRKSGEWGVISVAHILSNETYSGLWHYGQINGAVRHPREQWVELKVPAIVDKDTWRRAQSQSKKNRSVSKRNVRHEYLMRCRLTCSCGYKAKASARYDRGNVYLYYKCGSRLQNSVRGYCGAPNFRADHVDALVWNWLSEWFRDPADLRRKLEAYQAEQDKINAPILALLKTNEDLIAENQTHLATVKRMCEAKIYTIEESVERKTRLDETRTSLEKARGELQARLAHQLSTTDIENVMQMSYDIRDGIAEANESFEKRRKIIEILDVRGILKIEDGEKVCYASFILIGNEHSKRLIMPKRGESVLSVVSTSIGTSSNNQQIAPVVISARLVLPNTRNRKPQADIGALFAQVPQVVTTEVTA